MNSQSFMAWCCSKPQAFTPYAGKPLVMGILNVTPDSFSDGGHFIDLECALQQTQRMIGQEVDLIDIGGESSRPGAKSVSCDEELNRVIPIIERIRAESDIAISIDTSKPEVMQEAVKAGACLINDIRALQNEQALSAAASTQAAVCLMHMQGEPEHMQDHPSYLNPVATEINDFFSKRIRCCEEANISRERIILDPGFGFGKSTQHNLQLLNHLSTFNTHQRPLILGVSRKSTLGNVVLKPILERLPAALAATIFAALHGVAIFRTHDVGETKQALNMLDAILTNKEQHDVA